MARMRFEEFTEGETQASPMGRTISEADVYTQAGLAGSYNPLHTDVEFMKDSMFEGRLVQNTLLITVMSGLARRLEWTPATVAAYGRENMRFVNPVYIGDTVSLVSTVRETAVRDEEHGVVTFHDELSNQDDDVVVVGDRLLLVERD